MRWLSGFMLVVALVLGTPASADVTGNDLKPHCDQPDQSVGATYCLGYLSGVIDTARTVDSFSSPKAFCEPPTVTGEQLLAMLRKYLVDHPDRLHFTASSLILDMYAETFGCPKSLAPDPWAPAPQQ